MPVDLPPHARGRPARRPRGATCARSRTSTAASAPRTPAPAPDPAVALLRLRRLLDADPGGAWVAERDGAVAGVALALLREGLWGLSLLVVDPRAQGEGVGRELLARACAYGDGARGHVILSSSDPRAMRAYARLGLELHPAIAATGVAAGRRDAGGRPPRRPGRPRRSPRRSTARCAAPPTASDILAMLAGRPRAARGARSAATRCCAAARSGCCAAFDDDGARDLLRGALARVAERGRERPRRVPHRPPAVGGRRLPRGPAGPAGRLRLRVHRRRRRAVLALPSQRGVPVAFPDTSSLLRRN